MHLDDRCGEISTSIRAHRITEKRRKLPSSDRDWVHRTDAQWILSNPTHLFRSEPFKAVGIPVLAADATMNKRYLHLSVPVIHPPALRDTTGVLSCWGVRLEPCECPQTG